MRAVLPYKCNQPEHRIQYKNSAQHLLVFGLEQFKVLRKNQVTPEHCIYDDHNDIEPKHYLAHAVFVLKK